MMKMIALLFLCNIICMNLINAQKCYVCDTNGCEHPSDADIQTCSEESGEGKSGKDFVSNALGKTINDTYSSIATDLNAYVQSLNINTSVVNWAGLTQWACYVTKDKHRGCFIMGKGLCAGDKSWLGQLSSLGDKINTIMSKATTAVGSMFKDVTVDTAEQKANISSWIAENYLSLLVNNTKGPQYQLDSCCESDKCNFASMIQKSTAVLIVLLLSVFILV